MKFLGKFIAPQERCGSLANIEFVIVHTSERAKAFMDVNKDILGGLQYLDKIEFFDAQKRNPWEELSSRKYRTDTWSPYDEREFPPLPGEIGIWVSFINIWEYMANHEVEQLLVLEDDVALSLEAPNILANALIELPRNWDMLSLHSWDGQNIKDKNTDIGRPHIHRSDNKFWGTQGMVYSLSGARKILRLVKKFGVENSVDLFLFQKARDRKLHSYSLDPSLEFLTLAQGVKSEIDPANVRRAPF